MLDCNLYLLLWPSCGKFGRLGRGVTMSNSHSNTLITTTRNHIYRHIEKKTWGKSAFGIHEGE